MYKAILHFGTCLFISVFTFGQGSQIEKKLDSLLSSQFKNAAQPGCAVLVAKHDQVIYKRAFGSANLELNVALKPDMIFNLASITKQFTAVAILQLIEQNKISLQDSIQKFIPDFPSKGYTITIENLLTHTSGIKDYMQIDYPNSNMERWDFSPKQLIDSFKKNPLDFEPGTKFSYSNSGYYLLGYIIEEVSGKRYQEFIQDNLLKPLGLAHTCFDSANIVIPGRVSGYRKEDSVFKNADYWSPTIEYAAGGLLSNVDDLFKWHQGLYAYKLVGKETLQKAFTPARLKNGTKTPYGYGWFLKTSNGVKSIEHEGGLPGSVSNEIYFPTEDIFMAVLCNSGTAPIDEISIEMAAVALGKPLQKAITVDEKLLDKYVGIYRLSIDKSRTIEILKESDHLIAKVSKDEIIPLIFQSETKFQFKNLLDADCEFVIEKDRVTKFNVSQGGHYEWIKTP